jgi:hypothetical protein
MLGVAGFTCRCEQLFCTKHRYTTDHSCPFDHKSLERARIAEANPTVAGSKIEKI